MVGAPGGQPDNVMPLATYYWQWRHEVLLVLWLLLSINHTGEHCKQNTIATTTTTIIIIIDISG